MRFEHLLHSTTSWLNVVFSRAPIFYFFISANECIYSRGLHSGRKNCTPEKENALPNKYKNHSLNKGPHAWDFCLAFLTHSPTCSFKSFLNFYFLEYAKISEDKAYSLVWVSFRTEHYSQHDERCSQYQFILTKMHNDVEKITYFPLHLF